MPSPKCRGAAATFTTLFEKIGCVILFGTVISTPLPAKQQDEPASITKKTEVGKFEEGKPYDLAKLISLALLSNPNTRAAWQNALAAAAVAGQARAPYYPDLSVRVTEGVDQGYTPNSTGPNYYSRMQTAPAMVLQYLLFDFGRRDADLQRTLHALDAANLSYARQIQQTMFAVQRTYFSYNAALSRQKAATENVELARTIAATIAGRMKSGLATQPEVLISSKLLAQAQFDNEAAIRSVKTSLGQLRTAAGVAANAPLDIAPLPATSSWSTLQGKLDTLVDAALANRPDLSERVAELRAGEAATRRARADFLPQVRLEADDEYTAANYSAHDGKSKGTYAESQNGYAAGVVVDWDLFDGFERVQKLKQRLAEQEGERDNVEATRLNTILDVWTSYYDVTTARSRVEFADSLLASSQETSNALQASFNAGLATIAELVQAQNELAAARYERADADSDYLTAVASLSFAMGTNIQTRTPKMR